jgi:hypothetical protein
MPPFVLTVLRIVFLALLYFFVYRAIRASYLDLQTAQARSGSPATRTKPRQGEGGSPGRPGKPPRSVVVIDDRGSKLATHPLDGQLQIGRAEACQIQLSDTYVSQFHARIFSRDRSWCVEDLGSTNGTYVNQRRITAPAELRAGDRVRVGKTTLELKR